MCRFLSRGQCVVVVTLSLFLLIVIALWVRSCVANDRLGLRTPSGMDYQMESSRSALYLTSDTLPEWWDSETFDVYLERDTWAPREEQFGISSSRWYGVHVFGVVYKGDTEPSTWIVISYWLPVAVALAGILLVILRARRQHRRKITPAQTVEKATPQPRSGESV